MRPNAVRDLISAGRVVTSAWMSTSSTYIAEVLSYADYDAVTVDVQHGMYGLDTAVSLLQAVSAGPAMPMARCSHLDEAEIGKLLDGGAYGVICPSIDDAQTCRRFMAACRYPPAGVRSFGPSRGLLYGGPDYAEEANGVVMTWAMIESRAGVAELEDILGVPGLDGVYLGPNDLALSMGQMATPAMSPEVKATMLHVKDVAHAHGKAVGAYCTTAAAAVELAGEGFDLIAPGSDVVLLKEAASRRVGEVRDGHAIGQVARP